MGSVPVNLLRGNAMQSILVDKSDTGGHSLEVVDTPVGALYIYIISYYILYTIIIHYIYSGAGGNTERNPPGWHESHTRVVMRSTPPRGPRIPHAGLGERQISHSG